MPTHGDSSSYNVPFKFEGGTDHHATREQWFPDHATTAQILISISVFIYVLRYLGLFPRMLSNTIWNAIVFLAPSPIGSALDRAPATGEQGPDTADKGGVTTSKRNFRAKSEAMFLGLDGATIFSSFSQARRFSALRPSLLSTREHVPPGLGNWDNSCYQNCIIQGMASLQSLDVFLENNIRGFGDYHDLSTHDALKGIIDRLNDPLNGGRRLWAPPALKSMSSWQQQDAHEYFSKIIDELDKEIRLASRRVTGDFGLKGLGLQQNGKLKPNLHIEKVESELSFDPVLRNPLEGLLAQRVGCMRCGWAEGLSLIPFNCLTVSLGGIWECDIRDCLDEYTSLEPIEGVECAKCTLQRTVTQLLQLREQIESDAELAEQTCSSTLTEALKNSVEVRLAAVKEALDEEDFSEKTLSGKCHIPPRSRVSSTKSRQAVVARAPKSLVIHVNRSVFDDATGILRKNYTDVRFPKVLGLDEWCLGTKSKAADDSIERWDINPSKSMLPGPSPSLDILHRRYELRAVITHYGRHENGHYICYRKYPVDLFPAMSTDAADEVDEKKRTEQWFRLSDEDVSPVSERCVLSQGGVFMLFYERAGPVPSEMKHVDLPTMVDDSKATTSESFMDRLPLKDISNIHQGGEFANGSGLNENDFGCGPRRVLLEKSPSNDSTMSSPMSLSSDSVSSISSNEEGAPPEKICDIMPFQPAAPGVAESSDKMLTDVDTSPAPTST